MLRSLFNLLQGNLDAETVWTADITYWIAGQKEAGTAREAWDTEDGYLQLHQDLGIMPYYYYEKFWTASPCYDERIHVSRESSRGRTTIQIQSPRVSPDAVVADTAQP